MRERDVAGVIQRLRPYDYGWRSELPSDLHFLGHRVALELETRPNPAEGPPPDPSRAEVELARLILSGLAGVLEVAERQYREHADSPDMLARLDRPRLWICREFLEQDGPDRWSFVAGIADAPDWVIHAEFRGLEFLEIWSGD